jgi:Pyruvate/2-oxoacid:ferredoxin oxidoreductase gamma subunit
MNQPSVDRYLAQRLEDGLVLVNSSIGTVPAGVPHIGVPATKMAEALGDSRATNFILLGAYAARRPLVQAAAIEREIRQLLAEKPGSLVELNVEAFRAGLRS